jgi:hypothetical protein
LLGLTDNEEMRHIMKRTDICRIMIRQLESENENKELILQIMINLSGEEFFTKKLIDFNVIYRVCTILFNKLDKENICTDNILDEFKDKLDVKYSKFM